MLRDCPMFSNSWRRSLRYRAGLLRLSVVGIALSTLLAHGPAMARDWPDRVIHLIVPYPAGGIADKIARETAEDLSKRLGESIVVENRAGAAGNIAFEYVARQPADGYTLLLAPASNLTVQPALFKSLPYDLKKDFTPVSLLVQTPQVLLVNPSVPVSTPRELVEYSHTHKVDYGVTLGAYSHLAGELMKSKYGADFTPIPYQGTAPALTDLLSGQTQFIFNELITAIPYIQSKRLKPLAVAYKTRAPWLPDVPTFAEAGYPGFEVTSWYAMVARAGTPPAIVDRLAKELHSIMQSAEFKKRYDAIGAFTVGSTPAELGAFIDSETVKWTAVVKQAGIPQN